MKQANFAGKVALVTGAGSGIGRATALALARAGADLVLCDISEESVCATADAIRALGRKALARRVDVSSRDAMAAFADEVHAQHAGVDLLVNNAGVAVSGGLLDTSLDDWAWQLGVNVMGVVHGCHFFVPRMVERGRGGHVVNIASLAGLAGSRTLVAYCTSKFAVVGLSEALRDELKHHRIGVTAICPGFVRTNISAAGRLRGVFAEPAARARAEQRLANGLPPERVAELILKAIGTNIAVLPVAPEAWVIYALKRLSPTLLEAVTRRVIDREYPPGRAGAPEVRA
ncbi:SDR family NAD(P)-dependent oxidoreductase [Polyangium aurulentum]|uniref:SDR family NAD(P)-dependent oxidoreductase n=1 Tax=Polyangium aurulentum TaxID=2567896 RepID=UPI0010ADFE89|nr:SDR family NAD(P)-dependent oxidoreductase [Polyangium aurulentum]UQA58930.1 SDR family NAD(P)-dependent oxidoreductase [Polyangium aurulentum]